MPTSRLHRTRQPRHPNRAEYPTRGVSHECLRCTGRCNETTPRGRRPAVNIPGRACRRLRRDHDLRSRTRQKWRKSPSVAMEFSTQHQPGRRLHRSLHEPTISDSPRSVEAFKEKGAHVLDAPVLASPADAANREVIVMPSGEKHIYEQLLPSLRILRRQNRLPRRPRHGKHLQTRQQHDHASRKTGRS